MVAGCIPEWQGRILLCRRAIEPRYGLWTIPAGFMENGETLEQAAKRETDEEACAKVELGGLYALYNLCLLYTSPSPRDVEESRMPSSA